LEIIILNVYNQVFESSAKKPIDSFIQIINYLIMNMKMHKQNTNSNRHQIN